MLEMIIYPDLKMDCKTSQKHNLYELSDNVAELGLKRMFQNNLIGAVDCFHKALNYNPLNYAHYLNRSYCYLMANKNSLALNDVKFVLQNTKELDYLFVAHLRAGMALYALEEYQDAELHLKKAVAIHSDNHYAKRELLKVQIAYIVQMGFNEKETILALQKYPLTLKALDYLTIMSKNNPNEDIEYASDSYNDYVYSSDEDGMTSNTDLINKMLNYTPGVTNLQPVSALVK